MGVPITDLPINVYAPIEVGPPYVAFIGNLPIVFRASSPIRVRKLADDWRREEVAKVEQQKERARKRAEARAEARRKLAEDEG